MDSNDMKGKFKIYRSSAGSGKTFTLTKEYIKLILTAPSSDTGFRDDYFRHILAITFTNDAANEMKARIIQQLEKISELKTTDNDGFFEVVASEIETEHTEKISRKELILRAKKVYERLLHNYSDFSVSTIDAFSNRVVRSFTKDLNLPYNYEIELNTEDLLTEATDELLARTGRPNEKELTKLLLEFARKNAEESKNWNLEYALQNFGQNLFREETEPLIRQLGKINKKQFQEIRNQLFSYRQNILNQLLELGKKGFQLIQNEDLNEKPFYFGKTGIYGYFQQHSIPEKLDFSKTPNSRVETTIQEDKWFSGKATATDKFKIESIKSELTDILYQIQNLKEKEKPNFILISNILPHIYLLGTINELGKQTETLMRQQNKVHISEFNRKINQIIENEPVPYIYERLGERYKHILIDEFQDTSMMQWHNLIPLLVNSLGFNQLNLIVGDAKQSIYRWRGGNAELIVSLPEVPTLSQNSAIQSEIDAFRVQANPQNLAKNWRSKENVIQFNNSFFRWLRESFFAQEYEGLKTYYQEVEQDTNPNKGGHVELTFLNKDETNSELATFGKVSEIVLDLTQNQGFELRDIAILTRRNSDASFLAEKFIEQKIQVISSESLLLTSSQKVKFVVNFLRILAQPLNPVAKSELLYFVYGHFYKELGLENLKVTGEIHTKIAETSNDPKFSTLMKYIKKQTDISLNFRSLQYLSIYEIAEELIRVFQLNKENQEQIYLQKMLDVMLDFSLRKGGNLTDFVEYWDKNAHKISVSTPETGNAIRIMTIHKSKGLEFPAVILPFANWNITPQNTAKMWQNWENDLVPDLKTVILPIKKDLQETIFAQDYQREMQATFIDAINMLYVAMTRAAEKLFVVASTKKVIKETRNVGEILRSYCETLENVEVQTTSEEQFWEYTIYEDHTPRPPKKEKLEAENYVLPHFLSTECRDKLRMRRDERQEDETRISVSELYSSRKEGILMHKAFEYVRFRGDIPHAVRRLIHEGLLLEEEATEIKNKMLKITNLPLIESYFKPLHGRKIRNERDLLVHLNGTATSEKTHEIYRPDRIVFDKNKVILMDYKTGQKSQKHYQQLRKYGSHFQKEGSITIEKYLIYTQTMEAVLVN